MRESMLLRIVDGIHAAGLDDAAWPPVLTDIADALRASGSILMASDRGHSEVSFGILGRIDTAGWGDYSAHYVNKDVRMAATAGRPVGSVFADHELLPPREYLGSEIYNDFFRRHDMGRVIGTKLLQDADLEAFMAVQASMKRAPFTEAEKRLLGRLAPHLARAVQVRTRLLRARSGTAAVEDCLERLAVGVVLLDSRGAPIFANRAASRIFAQQDGLSLQPDGLHVVAAAERATLARLLRGPSGALHASGGGGSMVARRPSGRSPFALLVAPVRRRGLFAEDPACLVFVTDPSEVPADLAGSFGRAHGLTRAETGLLQRLLAGRTPAEAARDLEVALSTVRSHLKQVFGKTGARSQSDLMRLVLSFAGGVDLRD